MYTFQEFNKGRNEINKKNKIHNEYTCYKAI